MLLRNVSALLDINRNYHFLWDFPNHFSPSSPVVVSTRPCSIYYHGESAFSEPETRISLARRKFRTWASLSRLHCYGQNILYRWGDEEDQSSDPSMIFMDPAFDSARGDNVPIRNSYPAMIFLQR